MLRRRLGTADAVVVGLGAMLGAGVFVVFAPAAAVAGWGLLVGLAVAGAVAYCNAVSSARLASRYPQSGGAYVFGRERLGEFWGFLAGWSFVAGKTASCAAMALTVGVYLWPRGAHVLAVAAVIALTAVNYRGIGKSAVLSRLIIAVVLAVLAILVTVVAGSGRAEFRFSMTGSTAGQVLQAAGLLFFAFAGYARITTLGEEVRDPARTIPRAVVLALGITLVVYAAVALSLLGILGPAELGTATAPLTDAVRAAGAPRLEVAVRAAAVVAAAGSLLSLMLGVSRTSLAMARDGHLPRVLSAVHPRFGVPHRAELTVAAVVAGVAAVADVRGAIGFSSFAVLVYYAIANAAAWTLGRRAIPVAGLLGCLVIAFFLPLGSVISGVAVLAAGAGIYAVRRLR